MWTCQDFLAGQPAEKRRDSQASSRPGRNYEALTTRPCAAPTATEKQGESIAAAATGGYYTLSEGTNQALHFYGAK